MPDSNASQWIASRPLDTKARALLWQVIALASIAALVFWLVSNTLANLEARRIASGFGFLQRPAGIPIGETLIDYAPGDSNIRAIAVGMLNTLLVSCLAIGIASILGVSIGVARLSRNWLLARLSSAYVEFVRNVPLLVHLLLYYALLQTLPSARAAVSIMGVAFISNRGLVLPFLELGDAWPVLAAALSAACIFAIALNRRAASCQQRTGRRPAVVQYVIAAFTVLPALSLVLIRERPSISFPKLSGFNFDGGLTVSPELTALIVGLSIYYGAFIAEIVRGGIVAVSQGQWEAGRALGLPNGRIMRLVVLPQALRLIIPPTTNQYLDLAKNSSLAIAIGYPDLVAVINSIITDTGQAIECVALIMAAFLVLSLSISALMNVCNRRFALVEH
jgi:general L-amino acid transport system permease protein